MNPGTVPADGVRGSTGRWLGAIKIALTVAASLWILHAIGVGLDDLAGLSREQLRFEPIPLLGSILVLALGYAVSATFWGIMVHQLGGPWIGIGPSVRLFMVANLGRYIPGKVWQLASLAILGRDRGVAPATGAAAAALGQGMGLVGAATIGSLALVGGPRRLGLPTSAWFVVGAVVVLTVTAPPTLRVLLRFWYRLVRQPIEEPPRFGWGFGPGWAIAYILNWAVYAAGFVLLVRSMVVVDGYLYIGACFAASYLIGYLTLFAPAGIGIRDITLVGLLEPRLGVPTAVAVALVGRVWTTAVEVLSAAGFALTNQRGGGGGYDDIE